MVTLAFSAGGAALASAFNVSASLGWTIGGIVGNFLNPPDPVRTVQTAQRPDSNVTVSTYGNAIPHAYGTYPLRGNIVWLKGNKKDVIKVTHTQTSGGKGGGPSQESVVEEYRVYASFRAVFAAKPASDLVKMYFNGQLVYDRTSTNGRYIKKGLKFRFYTGAETQQPDYLEELDVGTGNAPAYRGGPSIVFDNLLLQKYGNNLPQIEAVIGFNTTADYPGNSYTFTSSRTTFPGTDMVYDRERKMLFVSSGTDGISRIRVPGMTEDYFVSDTELRENFPTKTDNIKIQAVDPLTGTIYGRYGSSNNAPIVKIDGDSLRVVSAFPSDFSTSIVYENRTTSFAHNDYATVINVYGPNGDDETENRSFLLTGSQADDAGILDADTMEYVWGFEQMADESTIGSPFGGEKGKGYTDAWWPASNSAQLSLYKTVVRSDSRYAGGITVGVGNLTLFKRVTPSDVSSFDNDYDLSGITSFSDQGLFSYDPDGDQVIGMVKTNDDNIIIAVDATTGDINWITPVPDNTGWTGKQGDRSQDLSVSQYFTVSYNNRVDVLDKFTGGFVYQLDNTNDAATFDTATWSTGWFYDYDFHAVIGRPSDFADNGIIFLDRVTGAGVTLQSIIEDICDTCGMDAADRDASDHSATIVPGFGIMGRSTGRGPIEQLQGYFFFDGIESDYQLQFPARGVSSSKTVSQEDLTDIENGEPLIQQISSETELPMRYSVGYIDQSRDYEPGMQSDKRAVSPFPAMYSLNDDGINAPIVLAADSAAQVAQKALYTAWKERNLFRFRLTQEYIDINPGDVLTLSMDDGTSHVVRVTEASIGANLTVDITARSEQASTYTSVKSGDSGTFAGQELTGASVKTKLAVHNIPLLRDADDQMRTRSVIYFQGGPLFDDDGWPGSTVFYSTDDENTWNYAGRIQNGMTYGKISGTFPAPVSSVFDIDTVSTLTFWPTNGGDALETITEAEFITGALNMLLIGNEIVNFRDVTDNGNGSYTLSRFLRGRRGTDPYAYSHAANEDIYLLTSSTVEGFSIPLAQVDSEIKVKAIGDGEILDDVNPVAITPSGEDLKPYAPVNAAIALDTSSPATGNYLITFDRRTRINGDWIDGAGSPPLEEDSESYECDILDGDGGAVVRTLTDSDESFTYTPAQLAADFGSPASLPSPLYVRIYQISAQVGRGKSYQYALTI